MDRLSRLTEQLKARQPELAEDDFLQMDDYSLMNGRFERPDENIDTVEPQDDIFPLDAQPVRAPPKDAYSRSFDVQEDRGIDKSFLARLDLVVSGGKLERFARLDNFEQFPSSMKILLYQRKMMKPTNLQSYFWPAMFKGRSICCVSPPGTSKTTGYLVPLMAAAVSLRETCNESESHATLYSLVLCPTGSAARRIASQALLLNPLKGRKAVKVVCIDQPSALKEKGRHADLLNGPDIVITTPALFMELLSMRLITMKSCRTFIVDEADEVILIHRKESRDIFTEYYKSYCQRQLNGMGEFKPEDALIAQVIVCSKTYSKEISQLMKDMVKRTVFIMGDKLEDAIGASSGIPKSLEAKVIFVEDQKLKTLAESMNSQATCWINRFVICCKDVAEGQLIRESLGDSIHTELLDEESKHFNFAQLRRRWNSATGKNRMALIVPDDILLVVIASLQIDNAQCLIHYSIPDVKGTFASRFIFLKKTYGSKIQCLTVIFVSQEDRKQAHELVMLSKRLGSNVPPRLTELRNSFPRGVCPQFASFGECPLRNLNCLYDHFFRKSKSDSESSQIGKQIKFIVTTVLSANVFYIRIIGERGEGNDTGEWITSKYTQEEILSELQKYDLDDECRISEPVIGNLYGISYLKDGEIQIRRVRADEFRDSEDESYVDVFHVDFGVQTRVKCSDLRPLPDSAANLPPFAVRCYMVGIKPTHNDVIWDIKISEQVHTALYKQSFLTGWISFTNNSNVWVEDVDVYHHIPSINDDCKAYNLKDHILKSGFAIECPRPHFASGITNTINKTRVQWKIDGHKKLMRTAFLGDVKEENEAYLTNCDSSGFVFLRLFKFEKQLSILEDELSEVEGKNVVFFKEGLLCKQKNSDGVFNRVVVTRVKEEKKSVDVFFLDHGEELEVDMDTCYDIETKHITKHPFQAIKVKVEGLEPGFDENRIYDLTRLPNEVFKVLLVEKLEGGTVPRVIIFVPTESDEKSVKYEDLSHLMKNQEVSPDSPLSFTVEIIRTAEDDEDAVIPAEAESERHFFEILENATKSWVEGLGVLQPSGGQIKLSAGLPEIANFGENDPEKRRQNIPNNDPAAFDYNYPVDGEILPIDDEDEDVDESDDDLDIRAKEDERDVFYEKLD